MLKLEIINHSFRINLNTNSSCIQSRINIYSNLKHFKNVAKKTEIVEISLENHKINTICVDSRIEMYTQIKYPFDSQKKLFDKNFNKNPYYQMVVSCGEIRFWGGIVYSE